MKTITAPILYRFGDCRGKEKIMDYIKDPAGIYSRSFAIVEEGLKDLNVSPQVREIIKRAAHATADIEFGKNLVINHESVMKGIRAIQKGFLLSPM
jgi:precorrin isomerase